MTPIQKAKFEEFKEWLLVWKDEHRKEYKDFARKMNSDDPMALLGMAQLLITVSPELMMSVVDCWDDDTLSADDWVDKANGIIMNYKDSNVTYGNYGYPILQLANGDDEDETPVESSTEEQMESAKAFIEENGSIAEFAQGIMRQILGDTEVPTDMQEMLDATLGELQGTLDSFMQGYEADESKATDEALEKLDSIFESVTQNGIIGEALSGTMDWLDSIKLANPADLLLMILTWLIHGKAFEKIVITLNGYADESEWPMSQTLLDIAAKAVLTSIDNGYRDLNQWKALFTNKPDLNSWILEEAERLIKTSVSENEPLQSATDMSESNDGSCIRQHTRTKSKSQPLSFYLRCDKPDRVIEILRKYIIQNNDGKSIALILYVLRDLDILKGLRTNDEFVKAILNQFSDIDGLRSHSSIAHAIGELSATEIYKGKHLIVRENEKYGPMAERLKESILAVMN